MDDLLHWLDLRAKFKEDQRVIEAISKSNQVAPLGKFHIYQIGDSVMIAKV